MSDWLFAAGALAATALLLFAEARRARRREADAVRRWRGGS